MAPPIGIKVLSDEDIFKFDNPTKTLTDNDIDKLSAPTKSLTDQDIDRFTQETQQRNKTILTEALKGTVADITAMPFRALGMRAPTEGAVFKDVPSAAEWLQQPIGIKKEATKYTKEKGWEYKDREIPRWENLVETGVNLAAIGVIGYSALQTILTTPQAQNILTKIAFQPYKTGTPGTPTFIESTTPRKGFEWLGKSIAPQHPAFQPVEVKTREQQILDRLSFTPEGTPERTAAESIAKRMGLEIPKTKVKITPKVSKIPPTAPKQAILPAKPLAGEAIALQKGIVTPPIIGKPIPPELQPLAEEAKKYKSAEEFVKTQKMSAKDLVESKTKEEIQMKLQKIFGNYEELERLEEVDTLESHKILDIADKYMADLEYAANERNYGEVRTLLNNVYSEQAKAGLIKTKSQLTDIWNKAQGETLDPKNFKTAEEFVKANYNTELDDYELVKNWIRKNTPKQTLSGHGPLKEVSKKIRNGDVPKNVLDAMYRVFEPTTDRETGERFDWSNEDYPRTGTLMDFDDAYNNLDIIYSKEGLLSKAQLTDIWNKAQLPPKEGVAPTAKGGEIEPALKLYQDAYGIESIDITPTVLKSGNDGFKMTFKMKNGEVIENTVRRTREELEELKTRWINSPVGERGKALGVEPSVKWVDIPGKEEGLQAEKAKQDVMKKEYNQEQYIRRQFTETTRKVSDLEYRKKQGLPVDENELKTAKEKMNKAVKIYNDFYATSKLPTPQVKGEGVMEKPPELRPKPPTEIGEPLTDQDIDRVMFEKSIEDYLEGEVGEANIYSVIKTEGGIAPYKKGMKSEYRESVPLTLRNKGGLKLDQMAETLKNNYPQYGVETESDLLQLLDKEKFVRLYSGVPLFPEIAAPSFEFLNKLAGKFDVEYPFKKIGKPQTGLALKNYFAKIDTEQNKGLDVIKGLNKLKFTDKEYQDLTFLAYQPGRFVTLSEANRKRMSPGYQTVRGYFKQAETQLKEAEIISEGFPQSMVTRLNQENTHLRELFKKGMSIERMNKIKQQIDDNQKVIDFIKEARIQFVPIPMRLWFKDLLETNPQQIPRLISQYFKVRKTVDLKGLADYLLEKGIITPEDLDIRRIIGSYAHQKGMKLAMGNIINTAKSEGLLKPFDEAPDGWQYLPSKIAPGLKGHKGHPAFIDYLEDNFMRFKGLPPEISRPLAYIKMMQFYNPAFLPAYDLYQAAWLGSLRSIKTPMSFVKAAMSIKNKDSAYYEAMENGAFSQPFMAPWDEYMKNVDREIASLSNPFKKVLSDITGKLEKQRIFGLVDSIYRLSWNIAWTGDKLIRMASYHHLKEKGFTPQEAAQNVAAFHGDYASLPPATKRTLNRIFFTPTFTVAMSKLQFDMANKAGKVLLGAKTTKSDKLLAQGLVALLSLIFARKMLFKKWGYTEDTFGYKYKKIVDTPEGEKELVIAVPTPDNILMRYWNRLSRIPQTDDKLEKILLASPFSIHPLWNYGRIMLGNKKEDGSPVYNPFDNPDKITKDIAIFTLNRLVRVTETVKSLRTEERQDGLKAMQKDLGSMTNILRWFAFPYLRNTQVRRTSYKIYNLQDEFKRLFRVDPPKTPSEEEIRLNNFTNKLEKLNKDLE